MNMTGRAFSDMFPIRSWLGTVALVALGGVAIAISLFLVTATTPSYTYLGPLCATTDSYPGFDYWTGQPHGRIYRTYDCLKVPAEPRPNMRTVVTETPTELVSRRAIPLPIGFIIGSLVTFGALAAIRRPRLLEYRLTASR